MIQSQKGKVSYTVSNVELRLDFWPRNFFQTDYSIKTFHRRNISYLSYCNLHLSPHLQLSKTSPGLSKMAAIYLVDVDRTPVYTHYFDISYIPSTVFFFNGQHMKVDYG